MDSQTQTSKEKTGSLTVARLEVCNETARSSHGLYGQSVIGSV